MSAIQNRQPAGRPTGGRFATASHAEAGAGLAADTVTADDLYGLSCDRPGPGRVRSLRRFLESKEALKGFDLCGIVGVARGGLVGALDGYLHACPDHRRGHDRVSMLEILALGAELLGWDASALRAALLRSTFRFPPVPQVHERRPNSGPAPVRPTHGQCQNQDR